MRRLNTQDFINKSNIIHENKYVYSKALYENSRTIVTIICKIHGEFQQQSGSHLQGRGCPHCANNVKSSNKEFVKKANKIHKGFYKYDNVDYKTASEKVLITCPRHGDFFQKPNSHLSGKGCRKCFNNKIGNLTRKNKKHFIKEANQKHNYRYNYSKLNYINNYEKVEIICKKHGSFFQNPSNHLKGFGCSKCSNNQTSKSEKELQNFLKIFFENVEINNRDILKGKELDIYIPELKKAIEFNGMYWHYSKKYFVPGKHAQKSNLCRDLGIRLLYIREDLWNRDKEKMKKIIINYLNNI